METMSQDLISPEDIEALEGIANRISQNGKLFKLDLGYGEIVMEFTDKGE